MVFLSSVGSTYVLILRMYMCRGDGIQTLDIQVWVRRCKLIVLPHKYPLTSASSSEWMYCCVLVPIPT